MKKLSQTQFLAFVFSVMLLLMLQPIAFGQQNEPERPRKFSSSTAHKALREFKTAERELIKKRSGKQKRFEKMFGEAHEKMRDEFVAKLKAILEDETKSGNLDEALEIRSAISYFEKLTPSDTTGQASVDPSAEKLIAENRKLRARAAALEAKLGVKTGPLKPELGNSIGMKFRLIPAGQFLMGSETDSASLVKAFRWKATNQFPQHKVTLSKPFYMGIHEVTVGQFRAFIEDTNYKTTAEGSAQGAQGYDGKGFPANRTFSWRNTGFKQDDNHPVVNVTWQDAEKFCEWLSRKENAVYRLPTEAQWEYACRAGSTSMYYNGNEVSKLTEIGNLGDASMQKKIGKNSKVTESDGSVFTNRVGQYLPNAWGLYDMTGNVSEMCFDRFEEDYYSHSPTVDPMGPTLVKGKRVGRGCGWRGDPYGCRSAYRFAGFPTLRTVDMGFRIIQVSGQ